MKLRHEVAESSLLPGFSQRNVAKPQRTQRDFLSDLAPLRLALK